jgi:predicted metal-binding membrane protein
MPPELPLTAADVWFTFVMWAVMTVRMMAPAASPVLMLYAPTRRGGRAVRAVLRARGTHWRGRPSAWRRRWRRPAPAAILSTEMTVVNSRLSGVILAAAGVYQLTPWKVRCLAHCRSPLGFLMANWPDGRLGAAQIWWHHGVYCLGCCWALMCVLFAVGVMNLVWVAALSVFVLLEKVGRAGGWVSQVAGAEMVVAGWPRRCGRAAVSGGLLFAKGAAVSKRSLEADDRHTGSGGRGAYGCRRIM